MNEVFQSATLSTIFLASLLGSGHCVAMCGGFIGAYSARTSSQFLPHFAYHSGRFVTYTSLGLIAGFLGRGVNDISLLAGIQRGAGIITGLLLITWGIASLKKMSWQQHLRSLVSKSFSFPIHKLIHGIAAQTPSQGALLLGLSSTLLPCGWLYGYAAVAAATGSPLGGALVMVIFWLGTLPLLVFFGAASGRLLRLFGSNAPTVTAILLIAAGLFSFAGHFQIGPMAHTQCH